MNIPRRLFRVWLGPKRIAPIYEGWWKEFQDMHPRWDCVTLRDDSVERLLPSGSELRALFNGQATWAGRSDILRVAALDADGGVYVDHDCLPLRPLDPLLGDPRPFAGKRSGKSLNNSVIGSPANHPAVRALLTRFPSWRWGEQSVDPRGPLLLTETWWNRDDVRLLPIEAFYSENRNFKTAVERRAVERTFAERSFPDGAYLCHWSSHQYGNTR